MNDNQIEKGLQSIRHTLKSSGIDIGEDYLEVMKAKLRGEISSEEFCCKVREKGKGSSS